MKAIFFAVIVMLGIPTILSAQGVKIDKTGGTANTNAILDVEATDAGMLIPRMTTAQKTTLGGGMGATEDGMIVYDTSTSSMWIWNGSAWVEQGKAPTTGTVTSSTGAIVSGTGFTTATVGTGINDITFSTPFSTAPTVLISSDQSPPATSIPTYCASSFSNTVDEFISNVTINTINNNSGSTTYSDFTAQSTSLVAGSSHTLAVTGTSNGAWTEEIHAWIDWNQDGDFDDANEAFYIGQINGTCTPCAAINTTVNVPATAINGSTRMRVILRWNTVPGSCDVQTYGETEDYTINVTGGLTGSPTITNITNVTTTGFRCVISNILGVSVDADYHFSAFEN